MVAGSGRRFGKLTGCFALLCAVSAQAGARADPARPAGEAAEGVAPATLHRSPAHMAALLAGAAKSSPEAFDDALESIWPDAGVPVTHSPAAATDGVMLGAPVLAGHRRLAKILRAATPDYRYVDFVARVAGDVVYLQYVQTGTLADGTRLAATRKCRFTVRNRELKEVWAGADRVELAPFAALRAKALGGN